MRQVMLHVVSPLVLLSFVTACAPPGEEAASGGAGSSAASIEADMQAISAVLEQEVVALTGGGDFSYLTDDAIFLPPNEPAVAGIEAIEAWAGELANQLTVNVLDYTDKDIVIAGDWAIERYAVSFTFTPAGSEESISQTLKGIHIYQRQADGSWKMAQDVWNNDEAPPES